MNSWMREYSEGAVIFHEGEPGNVAFILTEGSVEISVGSANKKKIVSVFKPVSVFGEMALILKNQQRTATAVATSPSKVAVITKHDFDEFLEKSPKLIGAALTALVHRLQNTTARLAKIPSLFMGMANLIDLMLKQASTAVKFDKSLSMIRVETFTKAVSQMFLVELAEVQKTLDYMENLGFLQCVYVKDVLFIDVPSKDDFLIRCAKIQETLAKMAAFTD